MARPGLHKHPKFKRLMKTLKAPAPHVRGYLELLWEVGYENGNPRIGDRDDVELACEYPGPSGRLFDALLACRWIDELEPGAYQIHDLLDHAPDYVRKRALREAQRKDKNLSADLTAERRSVATNSVRQAPNGSTPAPAPAPAPAPKKDISSEPQAAAEQEADEPADYPAFATVGKERTWLLTTEQMSEWSATFPNLPVADEARKAHGWLRANPGRRKTARGMPRFLYGWLERSQNRRGDGSRGVGTPAPSFDDMRRQQNIDTLRSAQRQVRERAQ